MPVDEQGMNLTVGTVARKKPWRTGHLFDTLSPFTNCTILSISTMYCTFLWQTKVTIVRRTLVIFTRRTTVSHVAISCSRTPQFPPRFIEASHAAKMFFFFVVSLLKWKKLQPSPSKLAVRPKVDGSELCMENGSELATARSSNPTACFLNATTSTRCSKASQAAKMLFFLAVCWLKAKKMNTFQEGDQFLKYCTIVTWRAWFRSRVTCRKVLKAFSLEPHVSPTGEPVDTTLQAKLSKLVKAACRYDIPLPRSQKLQTHTDTHTEYS